jgi:hypothetical protein
VNRLPEGRGTTYFQFGAEDMDWSSLSAETYRIVERFLLDGGRLVITLDPAYLRKKDREKKDKADEEPEKDDAKKETSEQKDIAGEKDDVEKEDSAEKKDPDQKKKGRKKRDADTYISLSEKWGLSLTRKSASTDGKSVARNVGAPGLPAEFPWHGDIVMNDPGADWTVLYRNDAGPVLAERKRGPGSIVIVTDSYLVSNEALVRDRQPALLAWLAGPSNRIVFDEAHHGIMETPGIASLARKYRLFGGAAALLVLAGLFIWKNSSSLSPARTDTQSSPDIIVGRNAATGFIGLLRRNISADRILDVCLEEWRKSFAHGTKFSTREKAAAEEIAQAEAALPPRERDAAAAYEKIRTALHRRSAKRSA